MVMIHVKGEDDFEYFNRLKQEGPLVRSSPILSELVQQNPSDFGEKFELRFEEIRELDKLGTRRYRLGDFTFTRRTVAACYGLILLDLGCENFPIRNFAGHLTSVFHHTLPGVEKSSGTKIKILLY